MSGELNAKVRADRKKMVDGVIQEALAIDPSAADVTLDYATTGLFIGTSGDLAVVFAGNATDESVILKNVAGGVPLPFSVCKVLMTGTTAQDIVGLY